MKPFRYRTIQTDARTNARLGEITTPHGIIRTPAFIPVGTQATVKSLTPHELEDLGVQMFFVNTYHTYLRPNLDVIRKAGGLHGFMDWHHPIITDSGGFQVFSLARPKYKPAERDEETPALVAISEDGVRFRSHWDGSEHFFTPESSMQYQWTLGSDIHIAFDECTTYPTTETYAREAMERTHRWAVRSRDEHERQAADAAANGLPYQALYGSVQGSVFKNLREDSARFITELDTDGIAIGGVSVGESKREMTDVLSWVTPLLPDDKPRHLLGVGEVDDIFAFVEAGMDTFDCVQPTRLARMGKLLLRPENGTPYGQMDVTRAEWKEDMRPIQESCTCYACTHFTRSYLYHLFHVRELLAYRLATVHNIHFMNTLVTEIRKAIESDTFLDLKKAWLYNK